MTAYGILRPVTPVAGVLLADNPSPMTLDGTNSWVLRAPGERSCVIVDPGPDDAARSRTRRVGRSILTRSPRSVRCWATVPGAVTSSSSTCT